jgi:hypothetical protein
MLALKELPSDQGEKNQDFIFNKLQIPLEMFFIARAI